MIDVNVKNESDSLESVILGIAHSQGGVPDIGSTYDPKSKSHILAGTYPKEEDMIREMDEVAAVLEKHNVKVFRPNVLTDVNQVFSRDICFVIDNQLIIPNVLAERREEFEAIEYIVAQVEKKNVIHMPEATRAEGGDVMPWNDYLFVGYSEAEDFANYKVSRTNRSGVDFLAKTFPNRIVKSFELNKSDDDPFQNALHLDCCFQPIGKGRAIMFPGGFKNQTDVSFLQELFGKENIIEITQEEMYNMNSNVFSISPEVILSEKGFTRLNSRLRELGYTVEEVAYAEISKQEGLLRCSTMPLKRKGK